jgi:glycosyltransferase involved in cell wall biosynthesis
MADRVVVHSSAAAAALAKRLERSEIVPHWPMPVAEWSVPASKWGPLSVQFGLHGRRLVTMFGFVTREKGYGLAIRAIGRIRRKHPRVLLLIAGGARDGWGEAFLVIAEHNYKRSAEMRLEAIARLKNPRYVFPGFGADHLHLEEALEEALERGLPYRFTGYLTDGDARAILEQTEIALLPYRSATGSYAAGAALAAGCPLLTSDLPAFAEPLPAVRFRTGDVEDLAQKLNELLEDDAALAALAERSRRYAARNNWARSAERHVALYRELIEDAA